MSQQDEGKDGQEDGSSECDGAGFSPFLGHGTEVHEGRRESPEADHLQGQVCGGIELDEHLAVDVGEGDGAEEGGIGAVANIWHGAGCASHHGITWTDKRIEVLSPSPRA